MGERAARGMSSIGFAVALASAASPDNFLRVFGVPGRDVTGAAAFGWRLFAVRTAYLSALAWQGDPAARAAFLPIQILDQAIVWHAHATRSIPRRTAALAASASAAIIALDIARRRDLHASGRQATRG